MSGVAASRWVADPNDPSTIAKHMYIGFIGMPLLSKSRVRIPDRGHP